MQIWNILLSCQTVHMFNSGERVLNSVLAWTMIVSRMWNTAPSFSGDTRVFEFWLGRKVIDILSNQVRHHLRLIVELIWEVGLGFGKDDVGLHLINSGGVMAMILSRVAAIVIQRVRRWESLAFLKYICEQVKTFMFGVSKSILKYKESHHLN